MALLTSLRRFLAPSRLDVARAPYLTHYQLVDRTGEVFRESDVPVIYFEDGPAVAKATLLNRADPTREWRVIRAAR